MHIQSFKNTYIHAHTHSTDRIIICLLDDIASIKYLKPIHISYIAAHPYIHVCMNATIWMCGSQYMVVVEERGQGRGRLTLSLASRLAPLSRSTFTTSIWPYQAEQWRAVQSYYQRQTHTVRERHLAMDDTTHHSQTHMQRDMAYTDTQTDMQQRII